MELLVLMVLIVCRAMGQHYSNFGKVTPSDQTPVKGSMLTFTFQPNETVSDQFLNKCIRTWSFQSSSGLPFEEIYPRPKDGTRERRISEEIRDGTMILRIQNLTEEDSGIYMVKYYPPTDGRTYASPAVSITVQKQKQSTGKATTTERPQSTSTTRSQSTTTEHHTTSARPMTSNKPETADVSRQSKGTKSTTPFTLVMTCVILTMRALF